MDPSGRKQILVIDDEPKLLALAKEWLEGQRYAVVTADNGPLGITRARETRPDLILLDLVMPQMDGYDVLRRLRNIPRLQSVPVIMLSAKSESSSILDTQDLRATDYFIKPFKLDELLECIQRHLG